MRLLHATVLVSLAAAVAAPLAWAPPRYADLAVSIRPDRTLVRADEAFRLTDLVENRGPDSALDVVVRHVLPPGVTLVDVRASQGSCTAGAEVVCSLGLMGRANQANGARATVVLTLRALAAGRITSSSSVSSASLALETVPENSSASSAVDVAAYDGARPAADLAVTIAGPKTAVRGRRVVAVARVWNIGPDPAEGVSLAGRALGDLPPGETRSVRLEATARPGLRIAARAMSATPDPQARNDRALLAVRVRAA